MVEAIKNLKMVSAAVAMADAIVRVTRRLAQSSTNAPLLSARDHILACNEDSIVMPA